MPINWITKSIYWLCFTALCVLITPPKPNYRAQYRSLCAEILTQRGTRKGQNDTYYVLNKKWRWLI